MKATIISSSLLLLTCSNSSYEGNDPITNKEVVTQIATNAVSFMLSARRKGLPPTIKQVIG